MMNTRTQQQPPMSPEQRHEHARAQAKETEENRRRIREASITQAVRDEHMTMIRKDEKRIAAFAEDRSSPSRVTMPERIFRENFLPIITGEAYDRLPPGKSKEQLSEEAHSLWLRVSGSPTNEVDVVEPNGNVAFTMPAMSSLNHANTSFPENTPPMKAYAKAHADRVQSSPQIAQTYMRRGMSEKIAHLFNGVDTEAERQLQEKKMEKVREYYGIKKANDGRAQESTPANSGPGSLDDMSYDD